MASGSDSQPPKPFGGLTAASASMDLFTDTGAVYSPCKKYRYRLWRYWDRSLKPLVFLMLNPSTATEHANDPTVERCQRRALTNGFGGLEVVNLFAYRSTNPSAIYEVIDPVGLKNDKAILEACKLAGQVVCAWGDHGKLNDRSRFVTDMLKDAGITMHALALNDSGEPKHPLYIPYDLTPKIYVPKHQT